ncbi:MAG: Jag N-terminal domain-containing protein [Actinomycetia bacterium]|nr:Jag N-terminal domain-containing protein [Actinomycetes bacterium]
MKWVEVQGKTVDVAVEVAIAELELESKDDALVEIIQEPKPSFLGMGGREAIVKVSRAPKQRRRRRRGRGKGDGDSSSQDGGTSSQSRSSKNGTNNRQSKQSNQKSNSEKSKQGRSSTERRQEKKVSETQPESQKQTRDDRPEQAPIEEQAEVAASFIRGLLDAFGLEGEVTTRIDDRVLYLDVSGEQTEALVGPKGSVMYSVLELSRTVVQRKTYGAPRMRIDIAGYAERRREALKIYAGKLADQVLEDEEEVMLEPMNAADRKVVHDAIAEIDDVRSYSEGEDPRRAVVVAYSGGDE